MTELDHFENNVKYLNHIEDNTLWSVVGERLTFSKR
jgi:hypothetical protein